MIFFNKGAILTFLTTLYGRLFTGKGNAQLVVMGFCGRGFVPKFH
jgi:hypothetical protein